MFYNNELGEGAVPFFDVVTRISKYCKLPGTSYNCYIKSAIQSLIINKSNLTIERNRHQSAFDEVDDFEME